MSNPGLDLQASVARRSAVLEQTLTRLALPATAAAADLAQSDLGGPGEEPASVARAFGEARDSISHDYDIENARARAAIQQELKQGGVNPNPSALRETMDKLDQSTTAARGRTLRGLALTEANAGLGETNTLLTMLGTAGGQALSGALKFGQNTGTAAGLLSQISAQGSRQGSAVGGIAGTVLGGLIAGILSEGALTGLGASLGGAAGSAVGGWVGG